MSENKKTIVSNDKLSEAGVYFGHRKANWNPKMKPYILTSKKGTHIIDVEKTRRTLEFAYSLVKSYAEKGASFIFVGTRKQAKETVKHNALRTNSHYVSERWLGGTLTNSRTIFRRVYRMFDLEKLAAKNFEGYTKKEGLLLQKELDKLTKNLSGIKNMRQRPNVMIVADPAEDDIAVKEAKRLGMKVIGIVDTNRDPQDVHVAIPANDDSVKSVTLIMTILADAIAEAKGGDVEFAFKEDDAIVLPEEPKKEFKKRKPFQRRGGRDFTTRVRKPRVEENKAKTEVKKQEVKQDISTLKVAELRELAKTKEVEGFSTMKKAELVEALS